MHTPRIAMILLTLMLGLVWTLPGSAEPITCEEVEATIGGCLRLGFFLNQETTQRITEVQVTEVEGMSGLFKAPDPFAAPLLTQPETAQTLAFNALGVPGTPSGIQTSTNDIADFVMTTNSNLQITQDPGSIFDGDIEGQGVALIESAVTMGLLMPNSSMLFPGDFLFDDFGIRVLIGTLNIDLTRNETVVDAFRLNITQDTTGGGPGGGGDPGPGPGGNGGTPPIPEPSTMLLLGSSFAGVAVWRWQTKTA